jgi:hypothetical protein
VDEALRRFNDGEYQVLVLMFPTATYRDWVYQLSEAAEATRTGWKADRDRLWMRVGLSFKGGEAAMKIGTRMGTVRWYMEEQAREFFIERMRQRRVPGYLQLGAADLLKVNVNENKGQVDRE